MAEVLSEADVQTIISRVKGRVAALEGRERAGPALEAAEQLAAVESRLGDGIYPTIDAAVAAARRAFVAQRDQGLDARRVIVDAIRSAMLKEGERLAYLAREETGLGRAEDKAVKNRLVTTRTPGPEDLDPQAVTGDPGDDGHRVRPLRCHRVDHPDDEPDIDDHQQLHRHDLGRAMRSPSTSIREPRTSRSRTSRSSTGRSWPPVALPIS